MTDQPNQPEDTELDSTQVRPKFLDLVENGWAGDGNPHKIGVYLHSGYRGGRMNAGKYYVYTDVEGKDRWEMSATADNQKMVGNLVKAEASRRSQVLLDELEAKVSLWTYKEPIGTPVVGSFVVNDFIAAKRQALTEKEGR